MNISKKKKNQKKKFLDEFSKLFLIIIVTTSVIQTDGKSIYCQSGIKHLNFGTILYIPPPAPMSYMTPGDGTLPQ